MPVSTKYLATIATAFAIALAAPAAFAADPMSNGHDTGSGATTMDNGMAPAKPHASGDAMSHASKDKMSGDKMSGDKMSGDKMSGGNSGDSMMSHDKPTH